MVSQNRILTVSYGTFSCTLEGFDDPFGTMKAIAEYFRDLAAEDRYFGAEPPQPDAAMLHRIAEREIQRRVEAKIQDNGNGVILRAAEVDRPQPVARPLAMPEPVAEVAPVPAAAPAPAAPALADPAPRLRPVDDGVAAKLARIRAAVDRSRVTQDDDEVEDLPPEPRSVVPLPDDLIEDLPEDQPGAVLPGAAVAEPVREPDAVEDGALDLGVTEDVLSTGPAVAIDGAATAEPAAEFPAALAAASDVAVDAAAPVVADDESSPAPELPVDGPVADSAAAVPGPLGEESAPDGAGSAASDPAAARPATNWRLRRQQRRQRRIAAEAAQVAGTEAALTVETPEPEPLHAAETLGEPVEGIAAVEPPEFDLDALEAALEGLEAEAVVETEGLSQPAGVEPAATAAAQVDAIADDLAAIALEPAQPEPAPEARAPQSEPKPAQDDIAALIARLSAAPAAAAPAVPPVSAAVPADPLPAADLATSQPALAPEAAPPVRVRVVKVRRAVPAADAPVAETSPVESPVANAPVAEGLAAAPAPSVPFADHAPDVAVPDPTPEDLPATDAFAAGPDAAPPAQPETAAMPEPEAPAGPVRPSRPAGFRAATPRPATPRPEVLAVPASASAPAAPTRPVRPERVVERRGMIDAPIGRGEAQVDRLLRQADTEMSGVETRRRTSTIAHLKAAVAATVADRLAPRAPDAPQPRDETAAYRNDLASAVRPQRPSAAVAGTDQPASRVAPLVLVSAQRIDRPATPPAPVAAPQPATAGMAVPSRPRSASVATAVAYDPQGDQDDDDDMPAANLFGGVSGFSDWLQDAPPADLAARLEAAGAWLMASDGLEGFNRPQLMRLAASDDAAESREAAMAAFGMLLREGRIVKARRGMFMLPENSAMLARARKAAG